MECDMCGKPATAVAEIEGARLNACANCAKHGKLIKQIAVPEKKSKSSLSSGSTNSSSSFGQRPQMRREKVEQVTEEVRKDFPRVLRLEREKKKLTQEDFAKLLQIKLSTYHHYEGGSMVPDLETARKLEHSLKIRLITTQKQEGWMSPEDKAPKEEPRAMMMGDFIKKK